MSPDEREPQKITDEQRREWDRRQREIDRQDAERRAWVPAWDADTYTYGVTATWVEHGKRWATTYMTAVTRQIARHETDVVRDFLRRGVEHQIRKERGAPINADRLELRCFLIDGREEEHVRIPLS